MPTTRKYYAGETDAIVRRLRRYAVLLGDPETQQDRRQHLNAVITEDFLALDEFLSSGKPLPSQWLEGRKVVKVAGQAGEASTEKVASKEEGT